MPAPMYIKDPHNSNQMLDGVNPLQQNGYGLTPSSISPNNPSYFRPRSVSHLFSWSPSYPNGFAIGSNGNFFALSTSASSTPSTSMSISASPHLSVTPNAAPPPFATPHHLQKIESQFCRNFTCCGIKLEDLHGLLEHFEESHALAGGHNGGMGSPGSVSEMVAAALAVANATKGNTPNNSSVNGQEAGGNAMATTSSGQSGVTAPSLGVNGSVTMGEAQPSVSAQSDTMHPSFSQLPGQSTPSGEWEMEMDMEVEGEGDFSSPKNADSPVGSHDGSRRNSQNQAPTSLYEMKKKAMGTFEGMMGMGSGRFRNGVASREQSVHSPIHQPPHLSTNPSVYTTPVSSLPGSPSLSRRDSGDVNMDLELNGESNGPVDPRSFFPPSMGVPPSLLHAPFGNQNAWNGGVGGVGLGAGGTMQMNGLGDQNASLQRDESVASFKPVKAEQDSGHNPQPQTPEQRPIEPTTSRSQSPVSPKKRNRMENGKGKGKSAPSSKSGSLSIQTSNAEEQAALLSTFDLQSLSPTSLLSLSTSRAFAPPPKPFKCPVPGCEKSYKQMNGLKYHRVHGHCNATQTIPFKGNSAEGSPVEGQQSQPDSPTQPRSPASQPQEVARPSENEADSLNQDEASLIARKEFLPYDVEESKPFLCHQPGCGKRYKNLNGLRYHYTHSGAHGALGLRLLESNNHPEPQFPTGYVPPPNRKGSGGPRAISRGGSRNGSRATSPGPM